MSLSLEVRSYDRGGRHRHGFTQILFPLRGSMQLDIEGKTGVVSSNRLAFIPEEHVHVFVPSRDCNLLVMEVESSGGDQPLPVLRAHSSFIAVEPWSWRLFSMFGAEIARHPRNAEKISPVAMTALQLLRPRASTPVETAPGLRMREAAQKLGTVDGSACVADVARGAGFGQSRFHALFRATHGQTPKQFRVEKLLDEAVERLLTSSEPVSQIAYALGYENASSFNRLFKRRFGITPSEFRARGS
ncbi:MAG: helix-turn-helix domain-containing protein [Hyphomicrobiales bacterium]|nr:helix-turn-helix domain-containing protein [Hyphomicrobiales bacterium]